MGKIIAIANQKGGVTKTTATFNIAAAMAEQGKKVLMVDLDSQASLTISAGLEPLDMEYTVCDLLKKRRVETAKCVYKLENIKNLSIIPSIIDLAALEMELQGRTSREKILSRSLKEIKDDYDYIIIDCPPNLGILTTNALAASDSVLIPIQCEYYSLEGVNQLLHTILNIQKKVNPNLDIEGVLLTMLDGRTLLGLEVVEDVRKFFNEKVFSTIIPRLVKLVEAPSHGKPIIEYDPKSKGALAYLNLAKEVIERNGK